MADNNENMDDELTKKIHDYRTDTNEYFLYDCMGRVIDLEIKFEILKIAVLNNIEDPNEEIKKATDKVFQSDAIDEAIVLRHTLNERAEEMRHHISTKYDVELYEDATKKAFFKCFEAAKKQTQ